MKDAIVRIVALVVILACVVMINGTLSDALARADGMDVTLKRGGWSAGLDRFLAHANWMRLLQYRAKVSSSQIPDEDVVIALYKRYDTLTDENPFLFIAYEHGGIEIASMGKGDLALKLLDKGIKAAGDTNWKFPYYAAYIAGRYVKDDELREKYLRNAIDIDGHPFHVLSQLVRLSARKLDDTPLTKARLWQGFVAKDSLAGPGLATHPADGARPTAGVETFAMQGGDPQNSTHAKARDEVIKLLRLAKAQADQATGKDKDKLVADAAAIEKIVRQMSPSAHSCKYCFAAYEAGDKFCPNCGRAVVVFGVCAKCDAVVKPGEKFCTACGTSTAVKKKPAKPAVKKAPAPAKTKEPVSK